MLNKTIAAGIMSGTSLDGIDVAFAEISGINEKTIIKQIGGKTYPYPPETLVKIKKAVNNQMVVSEVSDLNFELAKVYALCVKDLANELKINTSDLLFVASHGQTVYHQGIDDHQFKASTLQLGSGPLLAQLTKTTVISDFRSADMAYGGQGAPLVPFVDYLLFSDLKKSRILQNIGGISNITVLPKGHHKALTYAFDTGPGNMMINRAMEVLFNKSFDDGGSIAYQGKLVQGIYDRIIEHPYLKNQPPKSCGREQFGTDFVDKLLMKYSHEKKEDIIHTITLASTQTMVDAINNFVLNKYEIDELIVAGGGIHNQFIMQTLKDKLNPIKVLTTSDLNLDSDFKEALAFIVLGNQTINKQVATLKETTGATKEVITGSISFYV